MRVSQWVSSIFRFKGLASIDPNAEETDYRASILGFSAELRITSDPTLRIQSSRVSTIDPSPLGSSTFGISKIRIRTEFANALKLSRSVIAIVGQIFHLTNKIEISELCT